MSFSSSIDEDDWRKTQAQRVTRNNFETVRVLDSGHFGTVCGGNMPDVSLRSKQFSLCVQVSENFLLSVVAIFEKIIWTCTHRQSFLVLFN